MHFFGRPLFGEGPRQHELGLEYRAGALNDAVQGGRHPPVHRVPNPALDIL